MLGLGLGVNELTTMAMVIEIAVRASMLMTAIHGQTIGAFGEGAVSVLITVVLSLTSVAGKMAVAVDGRRGAEDISASARWARASALSGR